MSRLCLVSLRRQEFGSVRRRVLLTSKSFTLGLFDCHVHLCMDPGSGSIRTDTKMEDAEQLKLMSENALKLLDAGVTTARDLGCPGTYSITLRDQINAGKKMGPRMLVANGGYRIYSGSPLSTSLRVEA